MSRRIRLQIERNSLQHTLEDEMSLHHSTQSIALFLRFLNQATSSCIPFTLLGVAFGITIAVLSGAAHALEFRFLPAYPTTRVLDGPYSVTNNGAYVFGQAYVPAEEKWYSYVWNESLGIGPPEALGLPSGTRLASADGLYFAGTDTHLGHSEAFRWSPSTGNIWLGTMPGQEGPAVTGISEDHSTIIGMDFRQGVGTHSWIWTSDSGLAELNMPAEDTSASAYARAVSSDGRIVVGNIASNSSPQQAVRWTSPSAFELIPGLPGTVESIAGGTSSDGSRVVGYMYAEGRGQAFLWEEGIGTVSLFTDLPETVSGNAGPISGDGKLVGGSVDLGQHDRGHAFLWTAGTGFQLLQDRVVAAGYDLDGWDLGGVADISRDGRFVTGSANSPTGERRGFLVDLGLPLTGDTNRDGQVDLQDLNNVRNHFGEIGEIGDTNDDRVVDLEDLNNVRNHFGELSVGAASVPEPAAGPLATILILFVCMNRIRLVRYTSSISWPRPKCYDR